MLNKYDLQGKFNEVVGKVTDDKVQEWRGIGQKKYGEIKRNAHMPEIDASTTSILSMALGLFLVVSGLYFIIKATDELL